VPPGQGEGIPELTPSARRIPSLSPSAGSPLKSATTAWRSRTPARPRPHGLDVSCQRGRVLHRGHDLTAILGISAFYHDSAAALVVNGDIVAARRKSASRARSTTRAFRKGHRLLPAARPGSPPSNWTTVAFYEKPLTKFERLLETSSPSPQAGSAASAWPCRCG